MNITAMSNSKSPKKHVLHWFRKGLRLHDNPSLSEAVTGASTYHCVYILDPWFAGVSQVGINRWRCMLSYKTLLEFFNQMVNCQQVSSVRCYSVSRFLFVA